jgi:type IV secretion system protein VirB6
MDETTMIARFLFDQVGAGVTTFANEGSASLIAFIGPLAVVLLTIYVLLWGVAMASGQISEPFTDGMKRIVRMCIIVGFALTAGIYQTTVVDLFNQAPAQMANAITQGTDFSRDYDNTNDLAEMLDNTLQSGFDIAGETWTKGEEANSESMIGLSGTGLTYQFLAILLCLIAVLIVAVAAGIIFVAWLALAVLLAVGPLFIMMAVFPATQRWFEAWLGQTVNYALLFVLVALSCALIFQVLETYLQTLADYDAPMFELLMVCLRAVGLTIACIAVLMQMSSVAASLASGAAIQAANIAGKLAGMGMATAAAGQWMFGKHRTGSESLNDPARSNFTRMRQGITSPVRSGLEMARRRFTSNTARQG